MNEDQTLECKDCHEQFIYTGGEQDFFERNNFPAPIRCKPCRDKRKAARASR